MPNFKNSKIFVIKHKNNPNLRYIAHTTLSLKQALKYIKSEWTAKPNILFYKTVEDWNDWTTELIMHYPCEKLTEILDKKHECMLLYNGTLNTPFRCEFRDFTLQNINNFSK